MPEVPDDGYTMTYVIPALPGVFEETSITYRRTTSRQHYKLWDKFHELPPDARFDRQRDAMLSQIKSWSYPEPLGKEAFDNMECSLFEAMIAEVGRLSKRFTRQESPEKN